MKLSWTFLALVTVSGALARVNKEGIVANRALTDVDTVVSIVRRDATPNDTMNADDDHSDGTEHTEGDDHHDHDIDDHTDHDDHADHKDHDHDDHSGDHSGDHDDHSGAKNLIASSLCALVAFLNF